MDRRSDRSYGHTVKRSTGPESSERGVVRRKDRRPVLLTSLVAFEAVALAVLAGAALLYAAAAASPENGSPLAGLAIAFGIAASVAFIVCGAVMATLAWRLSQGSSTAAFAVLIIHLFAAAAVFTKIHAPFGFAAVAFVGIVAALAGHFAMTAEDHPTYDVLYGREDRPRT